MANQDRYKLTPEDIAILTRPGGWRAELERMEREEPPDPKYFSKYKNTKKKVKK